MSEITRMRPHQQRLNGPKFEDPATVVSWLDAVQSQDFPGAKWSINMRMTGTTDSGIEQAFNTGAILRTHVMRPTWHFVAPEDIRWLLMLTGPRVKALNAYMDRKLELDDVLSGRANTVIAKALEGGRQLTRQELAGVLAEIGIVADGHRLSYIMMRAELDAVICSGARRGKQFTYALLDERAPQTKTLKRDEALVELTLRYFTSHGPATIADFAWWSGLTKADVRIGLDLVGSQLEQTTIDGQTYWFSSAPLPGSPVDFAAFLLPTYDEYLIGYTDRRAFFESNDNEKIGSRGQIMTFDSTVILDGFIQGSWRRVFKQGAAVIEFMPFRPFTTAEDEAFTAARQRFSAFLEMPVMLAEM
jgi:hypothetical protein